MAERLTRNNKVNFYFHDEASNMVYYKLQKLEDIMEKYHCNDIEELEKKLADSDTWKMACELACKWFKQTGFIGDQTKVDYFYQQAKKEGENK